MGEGGGSEGSEIMAKVRKLDPDRDGDAVLSVVSDDCHQSGELFVVGEGKEAYMTVHYQGGIVAFSGPKTLRAIADAIKKALKG